MIGKMAVAIDTRIMHEIPILEAGVSVFCVHVIL